MKDILSLHGLEVRCIVGVYPHERDTPQPVIVDVDLTVDTRSAAEHEELGETIDYGFLCGELRFLLEHGRFRLIETAAHVLARWILLPTLGRPRVDEVRLRIEKPAALGGARPFITIVRGVHDMQCVEEPQPFGTTVTLHAGRDCGVTRMTLWPGKVLPTHLHKDSDQADLVIGDGLRLQGKPVRGGVALRWPRLHPHRYDNPSAGPLAVLTVAHPALVHHDFIASDAAGAELHDVAPASYRPAGS